MEPKALPPARISAIKLFNKSSLAIRPNKINVSALKKEDIAQETSGEIVVIKKQVIQIRDLITTNTLLKAKEEEQKRKEQEKKEFAEKEEKIEKPKEEGGEKVKLPALPKLSFLDRIKKFLFNILLGFIVYRLVPHLPKLLELVKVAGQALNFVTDWGGKLLNGLVTFIDWGYKAYDNTRAFLKNLGGENFVKVFDGFMGAMNKVIEASIIAMIAFGELKGEDFSPDFKKGEKPSPTKVGRRQFERSAIRLSAKTFGRGGAKIVSKFVRPFLKRLPIIGALIDFGLSVALGEDPGRAAFKAIGAGLLGSVGAAVGTVVPIAGNIIGGVVGGALGDAAGGALYDSLFGKEVKQKSTPIKVQGRAGGGPVTRFGKIIGGPAKREIKKTTARREIKVSPTELKPGSSVGGDKEIQKVFPESKTPGTVNTLGYTEKFYDKTTEIPFFGPIFGIATKALLGDKPSPLDYENAGRGINSWMNNTFSGEVLRTGGAFAEGGEVNAEMFMKGEDLTKVIAKSIEESVSSRLDNTLNDLMKEMMLKPSSKPAGVPGPISPETEDIINIQGGDADFWTLVAVASLEDGEPQSWADVAQSIYNRLASGAYSGKTIKELILGQMQYEPTWRYPKGPTRGIGKPNPEWYQIKDAASASLATGQSEEAMKKVAAALLDPNLQKNAREFIQGRTDFRGYSVSGGIQRKSGDNYYGWYNNYRANKIGSVPNFGATASVSPGGPGPTITGPLGTGKVSAVDQFTPIAQRFGLKLTSDYRPNDRGYHGKNRARDYSNDAVGRGTSQQLAFAKYLVENYGSSLTQLIYTPLGFGIVNGKKVGLDYWGDSVNSQHYHHVHVAFGRGGLVRGFTRAILGERGPEFVLDADTTASLEQNFPGFLSALNKANYDGAIQVLKNYAYYEQGSAIEVAMDQPQPQVVPMMVPVPMSGRPYDNSSGEGDFFDGVYNRG